MILNMITIPKFKIKVIDLKSEVDIKHYFFENKYSKKEMFIGKIKILS